MPAGKKFLMPVAAPCATACDKAVMAPGRITLNAAAEIEVALLTGGSDRPYAFGLSMALAERGIRLDVVGSAAIDSPEMYRTPGLNFLSLLDNRPASASFAPKAWRVLANYVNLIRYAATAQPKVFHILWNYKFQYFDRTLLMLYYKALRKKIVFTAHNVNDAKRDSTDSALNRFTLEMQYRLCDHIFVHTDKMKAELLQDFAMRGDKVSVIPFGINNSVPDTDLTPQQAKRNLNIGSNEKSILFFGRIGAYKGLKYLVDAFLRIVSRHSDYRLIIVGQPKQGADEYLAEIQKTIDDDIHRGQVIRKIEFVPDEQTELYFKAADVLVLPYTQIFQSGVIFLGYSFGLPVIATDVGSFKDEIIEGRTGFICKPCDSADLAETIEKYFRSDLFANLSDRRQEISEYAHVNHSWDVVGDKSRNVYAKLLGKQANETVSIDSHRCL
jgi:glycosyltransferase involved in cell wall biosynthesis